MNILFRLLLLPLVLASTIHAKVLRENHDTFIIATDGDGVAGREIVDSFIREAFPDKQIKWSNDYKDPDLLVSSFYFNTPRTFSKRTKVPYVVFSGESILPPDRAGYQPLLRFTSSAARSPRDVYAPQVIYADYDLSQVRQYPNRTKEERPNLVCYVNSHEIAEREELFRLLRERDPERSHARGTCSQTHPRIEGSWSSGALFDAYSKYRFVFAMENEVVPGYVTEKIMNAFRSGAVPIFWGDSEAAANLFNPDAYVDVGQFDSLEKAADYIIALDKDEERYQAMAQAPVFTGNQVPAELAFREQFPKKWSRFVSRIRKAYQ